MSQKFSMTPIAHIHSDFAEKFGVPRQSGLVEELEADIVFEPDYQNPDALRGLEDFSHIWLIWVFDRAIRDTCPPRSVHPGWEVTPGWAYLPPALPSGPTPLLCPA